MTLASPASAPQSAAGTENATTDFRMRLSQEFAINAIKEEVKSGVDPKLLSGRGLAKKYQFGSHQTWITALKEWRQQNGYQPKDAEDEQLDNERGEKHEADFKTPEQASDRESAQPESYAMSTQIMRTAFGHVAEEMLKTSVANQRAARLEGERDGRVVGLKEGEELAARVFAERAQRERLEGQMEGAQRAKEDVESRIRKETRSHIILAATIGLAVGAVVVFAIFRGPSGGTQAHEPAAAASSSPIPEQASPSSIGSTTPRPTVPAATQVIVPGVQQHPAEATSPSTTTSASEGAPAHHEEGAKIPTAAPKDAP